MARQNNVVFRVDDGWDFIDFDNAICEIVDASEDALALRFITSAADIEAFSRNYFPRFRPFTFSGSGDFHHLSAVWIQQFTEPFTLISLDNHPDWDIRPPKWCCGAWINRALQVEHHGEPLVTQAQVWGCGSFECQAPWYRLGNRAACLQGRLEVHNWRRAKFGYPNWLHPMERATWREEFSAAMDDLDRGRVYLTIDLDSLTADHATTNWESGLMTREDVLWAVSIIQEKCTLIGGDICGGYSTPIYKNRFQKIAGWFDHPRVTPPDEEQLARSNGWVWETLWTNLIRE